MEEMLSECCEAPRFRYEKHWDAGICTECRHVNSVKREKELDKVHD